MSEAIINPPAVGVDPEVVAAHLAIYQDKKGKKLDKFKWAASKEWLIVHKIIPDDRPPAPEPSGNVSYTTAIGAPTLRLTGSKKDALPPREPVLVTMSNVEREETNWLWPDHIPLDTVSMLVGNPGDGKSSLALLLASIVSSGRSWPDNPGDPTEAGEVLILQAEMGLATIVTKRLEDEGADLDKVHVLTKVKEPDGTMQPFNLARDMPMLEKAIETYPGLRLVIIDPIGSYLGGSDENKNAEIREIMDPMFALAEKHHLAVVLVAHMNKGTSTNILSRISGSIAFGAAARMIWYVSRHPKNRARRVMSFVKGNLTDGDPKALTYGYFKGKHQWDPEPVEWNADDVARMLLDQLGKDRTVDAKGEEVKAKGRKPSKGLEGRDFVLGYLKKEGPTLQSAMQAGAKPQITPSTFRRIVEELIEEGLILQFYQEGDTRIWLKLADKAPPETTADPAAE
ncbi:AAA family ATPase [Singulisphaera sp. PoT]|uniref:AAA family ATPase n=1 Tax=Singulisphaera sp. PoT TaxID=3411797 RepID=UPI003BF4DAE6